MFLGDYKAALAALEDVKVNVVVGGEVSPAVTCTDVGLRLQVGAVAAAEDVIVRRA